MQSKINKLSNNKKNLLNKKYLYNCQIMDKTFLQINSVILKIL